MSALRTFPSGYADAPVVDRLIITRHELIRIEARRVRTTLKWLIPIGEAAFAVAKPNTLSDTDYELHLRDAIELAQAESWLINADLYYACSAGNQAVYRLACRIADVIGEEQRFSWDFEWLWELARKVIK